MEGKIANVRGYRISVLYLLAMEKRRVRLPLPAQNKNLNYGHESKRRPQARLI